ncbi:hypothetical protein PISL3812_07660 [Talaromyces islandicus]|uniref:G-patch domain-containing protein n=1 Tax=Talaromyces islandicus TaxID=28573 RepID=A0A0U1M6Q6_TALIS|nr:hypothetical protein PISL3812_07660 [Talaromyces islandicus]
MSHPWDDDEDDYVLPLEDQRVFGAGIKRKRVPFVRASGDLQTTSTGQDAELSSSSASVADRYFSIVMSKKKRMEEEAEGSRIKTQDSEEMINQNDSLPASSKQSAINNAEEGEPSHTKTQTASVNLCELCNLPLSEAPSDDSPDDTGTETSSANNKKRGTPHEASIAHQVCLEHSHPPSHLDRTRHGLRYLAAYGWDPDSRVGLGVAGRTGIREPIKQRAKNDTIGLGMAIDDKNNTAAARQKLRKQQQEQRKKLNAKQVRGAQMADRKKGDQLRELFYGSDDIQRYLGGA